MGENRALTRLHALTEDSHAPAHFPTRGFHARSTRATHGQRRVSNPSGRRLLSNILGLKRVVQGLAEGFRVGPRVVGLLPERRLGFGSIVKRVSAEALDTSLHQLLDACPTFPATGCHPISRFQSNSISTYLF